ncbi:hypothetical protein GCM10009716_46740 [Streptomyces sodiiphilus]|uniref:Uncharacterized protein n=1 Tax=Streptomyces sodiiphilus TaxID=226217 RepID=A0ABP5B6Y5_9ACTN
MKKLRVTVAGPLALLLVSGVAIGLFAVKKYPEWQDRRYFSTACSGYVDHAEMQSFLSSERLIRVPVWLEDGTLEEHCRIESRDGPPGGVSVMLGWADEAGKRAGLRHEAGYAFYSPLPNNAAGFVNSNEDGSEVRVVLFLECDIAERHIMAQIVGQRDESSGVNLGGEETSALGQIAVGTAQRMGEAYGCAPNAAFDAQELDESYLITKILTNGSSAQSASEADGTCRSLKQEVSSLEELQIRAVLESPSGRSPVESCLLLADEGEEYWLTSWYGPFAQELVIARDTTRFIESRDHGVASDPSWAMRVWGSGECSAPFATAKYALRAGTSDSSEASYTEAELAAQRKLLNVFAAESAERHGCKELALP